MISSTYWNLHGTPPPTPPTVYCKYMLYRAWHGSLGVLLIVKGFFGS